jgi:hypothetical protein
MPLSARAPLLAALALSAGAAAAQQTIDGCQFFPTSNIWNVPVASLPVAANSAAVIARMNPGAGLHPDFGAALWDGGWIGIPYDSVPQGQPLVPVDFATLGWADESDPGPYPIPGDPKIEGEPGNAEGDRHVLVLRQGACLLYETYYSYADGEWADSLSDDGDEDVECEAGEDGWCAASGAIFDLGSNALRPAGWTSADAAGLPILPGLASYPEAATGEIRHALRFTVAPTRTSYLWPARHQAGSGSHPDDPPMGLRVRLKSTVDLSGFSPQTRVILLALKRYGMILADNGSDWFVSGAPHPGWDDEALLSELSQVHGSDFEVVDVSGLQLGPSSGATPHLFSDGFERGEAAFELWTDVDPDGSVDAATPRR